MCYSPAQMAAPCAWGGLCCFSLPRASPIASLGGTGMDPWGLWWNPRPPWPFHTASCCGQCPLSGGKGLFISVMPWGPFPGSGMSHSHSCVLLQAGVSESSILYTHPPPFKSSLLTGHGQREASLQQAGSPFALFLAHVCPCSSVVLLLASGGLCCTAWVAAMGGDTPATPSCCLCPTQPCWNPQSRMSPFSQSSYHGLSC